MTREEDLENKVLFSFLKDGKDWRTSYNENTGKCKYHNPINTAAYGLQFHESEVWLNAAVDKFQEYVDKYHINMDLFVEQVEDKTYCFKVFFAKDTNSEKEILYHFHSANFKVGLRKVLVQIVQDLTFKFN